MVNQKKTEIIEALNKHFKTVALEKHPDAMIQLYLDEAWNEVCGADYKKQRVSERDRERIKEAVLKKLRKRYGKWISVINFSKKFSFRTNFEYVYKTELGRLYGSFPSSGFRSLFFTSHSLEQFDERVDRRKLRDFDLAYKRAYGSLPTAADILTFFFMVSFQIGIFKNFVYINVNFGILVLEVLSDEVHIAKTFLTPDMVDSFIKWYEIKQGIPPDLLNLQDIIKDLPAYTDPIDEPVFELPDFDYAFFDNIFGKKL